MTPPEPAPPRAPDLGPLLADRLRAYTDVVNNAMDDLADETGVPMFSLTETPEERDERFLRRNAAARTRWAERLPVMYADATVAQVAGDRAHLAEDQEENLAAWWNGTAVNLVLAGPLGTGKTHLAYALGNAKVAEGGWAEAWPVVDLLAALRPDGQPHVLRDVRRCDLLVLDDLGATKASEWAVEQMTGVLDARIREGLRTVVTTNVPEPVLEAAWGGRFMDRLRYRRAVVQFHGESRRQAAW